MADLFKAKEREFYIDLNQERYFFPGENISGDVVLNLTKQTKVNNIRVVLDGKVELGGRSITLFSKFDTIAQSPEGEKSHHLDAYTHRFPFTITIPTSKEYNVPSTLEIAKLVQVSYQITATLIKPFVPERYSAQTAASITILEKINVESEEYQGDKYVEKELCLFGTEEPVKVSTLIGKRAAVKGDVIPVHVTVNHIGVMVRDKAISVQLLRSVYYGKNNTELYGPKVLKEVTANIEISGPVSFSKTFPLKLTIPKNICPTVDKSGQAFKIEYTLQVSVNLNEENPYRKEIPQDVVLFNIPFTIGTCPKLSFNIDDDEDDDDYYNDQHVNDNASNHSAEFDQVTKTMQDMDLSLVTSPIIQQDGITPLAALSPSSKPTYITPLMKMPPRPSADQSMYKPDTPSSPSTEVPTAVLQPCTSSSIEPLETFENPGLEYADKSGGSASPTVPLSQLTLSTETSPQVSMTTKILPQLPQSPVFNSDEGITVTSLSPYKSKTNISPSDVFNDYNPGLSPTSPVLQNDGINSAQPSASTSTALGRNKSFHLIVRNQETQVPVSPEISQYGTNLPTKPALPPRPTQSTSTSYYAASPPQPSPSSSNHTHGGYTAHPTPLMGNHPLNGFPPHPTPSLSNQTHHGFPPHPTPSISSGYNGYPSRPPPNFYPQQGFNYPQPGFSGMPEPQYNYQYNQYSQPPTQNMPMPQFGMGMSSYQNYPPPPSSYPYHHNN